MNGIEQLPILLAGSVHSLCIIATDGSLRPFTALCLCDGSLLHMMDG